jgi:sulfonate transport system ATP-binding protein
MNMEAFPTTEDMRRQEEEEYDLLQRQEPEQARRILKIEDLRKTVTHQNGSKKVEDLVVLDNVNFEVMKGEFVTLLGPSGCGKSTLLNIIAGLDNHDSGDIVVSGHRITSMGPDIVIIFQEDALFPWLTVFDNVAFGLRQRGISEAELRRVAMEYIDLVQLNQFANSYIHQLSGGMKQRVAIARGLALNPRILLMDEPFGALDHRTREILQAQIQRIHQRTGKTILFVTHDVREAVCLGDRVILFTHRPARIKNQYVVDLPRPRSSEDPRLQGVTGAILKDLKEEVMYAGTQDEIDEIGGTEAGT